MIRQLHEINEAQRADIGGNVQSYEAAANILLSAPFSVWRMQPMREHLHNTTLGTDYSVRGREAWLDTEYGVICRHQPFLAAQQVYGIWQLIMTCLPTIITWLNGLRCLSSNAIIPLASV